MYDEELQLYLPVLNSISDYVDLFRELISKDKQVDDKTRVAHFVNKLKCALFVEKWVNEQDKQLLSFEEEKKLYNPTRIKKLILCLNNIIGGSYEDTV